MAAAAVAAARGVEGGGFKNRSENFEVLFSVTEEESRLRQLQETGRQRSKVSAELDQERERGSTGSEKPQGESR